MEQVDWYQTSSELAAFYPEYQPGQGDLTQLITIDGRQLTVKRSVRAVLGGLTRSFAIDLYRVRQLYGQLLGQRNSVPIPLTANLVLVPLKVRKPRLPKDGTIGYLSYHQYAGVEDFNVDGYRSKVILKNGYELPCLICRATVQKQISKARLVYDEYMRRHGNNAEIAGNGFSPTEVMQVVQSMLVLCRNLTGEQSIHLLK